jgi:hypothetical protein
VSDGGDAIFSFTPGVALGNAPGEAHAFIQISDGLTREKRRVFATYTGSWASAPKRAPPAAFLTAPKIAIPPSQTGTKGPEKTKSDGGKKKIVRLTTPSRAV